MAKLIVKLGAALLGEYPLTKMITTVGRAAKNDIVIDHPAVSAYHARFEKEGDRYTVADINSTNGTSVNGQRIARLLLSHKATLTVGRHTLVFDDPQIMTADATLVMSQPTFMDAIAQLDIRAAAPAVVFADDATMVRPALPQVDADATMMRPAMAQVDADATMMRPALPQVDADATMMRPAAGLLAQDADATMLRRPAVNAGRGGTGIGVLTVMEGATVGAEYQLSKRVTTIGETANAEIRLKGLFAPKVAALINRTGAGYLLNPSPGEIPPLINGKVIEAAVLLQEHDVVEIVNLKLRFSLG
jgi:hypothetical protein